MIKNILRSIVPAFRRRVLIKFTVHFLQNQRLCHISELTRRYQVLSRCAKMTSQWFLHACGPHWPKSLKKPWRMRRARINEKCRTLVSVVNDFVRDHGFAAHERRREITGSIGVSLQQIQEHCFENVPGLRDHAISISTIHRLFHAPSRRTTAQL